MLKKEITFATVPVSSEATLLALLDEFEALHNIRVNLQFIPWDHYRQDFANITVHRIPCDVGATGTPATSDLIAMNALRPFTPGELRSLGGEAAFLSSRWQGGKRPGSSDVWAIPWAVDLRLFYYRKDLLVQAGVDESQAFESPQKIEQAIQQLKDCAVEAPWMTFFDRFGVLHRVASWIWAHGGDLFTADGKRAIFHEQEALEGMRAYFNLVRFIPANLKDQNSRELMQQGRVGISIENGWGAYAEQTPEIGCAAVPGGSYLGGSDLIIWNHSRSESAALELVHFLSRSETSARLFHEVEYLPARLSELNALAQQAPHLSGSVPHVIVQAALTGRTFPCVPMIGLIEERLGQALLMIQEQITADPGANSDLLLAQNIIPLGKRTNISLDSIP